MRQGNKGDFFRSFYFIFLLFHFLKKFRSDRRRRRNDSFLFLLLFLLFLFPFFSVFFSPSFPRFLGRRVLFLRPPSNRILPSFFFQFFQFFIITLLLYLKKDFRCGLARLCFRQKKISCFFLNQFNVNVSHFHRFLPSFTGFTLVQLNMAQLVFRLPELEARYFS